MASTYVTDVATSNAVFTGKGSHVFIREATYEITEALVVDDVIQMIPVAKGERVVDCILITDDLDTNGTPTITLDVGDDLDPDRYIDGSDIGQTGGHEKLGAGVAAAAAFNLDLQYTADNTIDVKVAVAPATGATTGTIKLRAFIVND